jgi:hypothetical protein
MELVCSTAGGDGEGGKGWRDFFNNAMAVGGDMYICVYICICIFVFISIDLLYVFYKYVYIYIYI